MKLIRKCFEVLVNAPGQGPLTEHKIVRVIAVAFLLAALGWGIEFRSTAWGFWRPGPLVDSQTFGDYEVKIYCRHENNLLENICNRLPGPLGGIPNYLPGIREWNGVEILKQGRRVYARYGENIGIAEFGSNLVAGLDITGERMPNLALTDQCGRQGGGSFVLFECGKKFRPLASIDSFGRYPKLKDLDGDGIPELVVSDDAFYHWPECKDGEPEPDVILRWKGGKYVPAGDLMIRPAPTERDLEDLAKRIRADSGWNADVPGALWTNAIGLMYSGHENLAWRFVDIAWKPGFPGPVGLSKAELIDYWLKARLDESAYWPELHRQFEKAEQIRSAVARGQ